MINDKAVQHYLAKHVEPEVAHLAGLHLARYQHILVVPAYRESNQAVKRIWPHGDPGLLIILVVNSWDPLDQESNALLSSLRQDASATSGNLYFIPRPAAPDWLVVDRCNPERLLPRALGVGLARKIGADLALALIHNAVIESCWIHSTDADVTLPPDYFTLAAPSAIDAAKVRSFQHRFSPELELASRLYDITMHYYVLGLRWAGSPHAYHSIGSTLSISARHYARVRGFPRRNAGEDFYLLNKLAKSGVVSATGRFNTPHGAAESRILIDARLSDRAPFGTGAALKSIAGLALPITQYPYYDPRIFALLRTFVRGADALLTQKPADCFEDSPAIQQWLTDVGLDQMILQQQAKSAEPRVWRRFMADWFDGFQTLKFVHYMRDTYYPSRSLTEVCDGSILPDRQIHDIDAVRALHQHLYDKLDEALDAISE